MKRFITIFAVTIMILIASPAKASITTGTWIMDQSNVLADGINYGQVDITANDATGVVSFTVDAFTEPYYETGNFGFAIFGFNYTNVSDPVSDWTTTLPTGWTLAEDGQIDGFGDFMIKLDPPDPAKQRQDPLTFSIQLPTETDAVASNFAVVSTGTASQGHVFFAAHVAGFTVEGSDVVSHQIGGPPVVIPTPGAILLGSIGTVFVGWLRKRQML